MSSKGVMVGLCEELWHKLCLYMYFKHYLFEILSNKIELFSFWREPKEEGWDLGANSPLINTDKESSPFSSEMESIHLRVMI